MPPARTTPQGLDPQYARQGRAQRDNQSQLQQEADRRAAAAAAAQARQPDVQQGQQQQTNTNVYRRREPAKAPTSYNADALLAARRAAVRGDQKAIQQLDQIGFLPSDTEQSWSERMGLPRRDGTGGELSAQEVEQNQRVARPNATSTQYWREEQKDTRGNVDDPYRIGAFKGGSYDQRAIDSLIDMAKKGDGSAAWMLREVGLADKDNNVRDVKQWAGERNLSNWEQGGQYGGDNITSSGGSAPPPPPPSSQNQPPPTAQSMGMGDEIVDRGQHANFGDPQPAQPNTDTGPPEDVPARDYFGAGDGQQADSQKQLYQPPVEQAPPDDGSIVGQGQWDDNGILVMAGQGRRRIDDERPYW